MPRAPRAFAAALTTLALAACAGPAPRGPIFLPAAAPAAGESLVYLYRVDRSSGAGKLRLSLDGLPLESLRNGEYQTLYVRPGSHELGLRWVIAGLLPTAWNRHRFCVAEGQAAYVRIWTGLLEDTSAASRARDTSAPGRPEGRASLNVFAATEPPSVALQTLPGTRLAPHDPRVAAGAAAGATPDRGGAHCREPARSQP